MITGLLYFDCKEYLFVSVYIFVKIVFSRRTWDHLEFFHTRTHTNIPTDRNTPAHTLFFKLTSNIKSKLMKLETKDVLVYLWW